jgi:transposase
MEGAPTKQIEKEHGVNMFTLKKWKRKWGLTGPSRRKAAAKKK